MKKEKRGYNPPPSWKGQSFTSIIQWFFVILTGIIRKRRAWLKLESEVGKLERTVLSIVGVIKKGRRAGL